MIFADIAPISLLTSLHESTHLTNEAFDRTFRREERRVGQKVIILRYYSIDKHNNNASTLGTDSLSARLEGSSDRHSHIGATALLGTAIAIASGAATAATICGAT